VMGYRFPEETTRAAIELFPVAGKKATTAAQQAGLAPFELDLVLVQFAGARLRLEPGQTVIPHGPDRDLTVAEALPAEKRP